MKKEPAQENNALEIWHSNQTQIPEMLQPKAFPMHQDVAASGCHRGGSTTSQQNGACRLLIYSLLFGACWTAPRKSFSRICFPTPCLRAAGHWPALGDTEMAELGKLDGDKIDDGTMKLLNSGIKLSSADYMVHVCHYLEVET